MKTSYFIILTLFPVFNTFSQQPNTTLYNYIANYKCSSKTDSNQNKYKEKMYGLLMNDNSSLFRPVGFLIFDSIEMTTQYKALPQDERLSIGSKYYTGINEIMITNIQTKNIEYTATINAAKSYGAKYIEKLNENWKLFNEKKIINGLECKKAECDLFGRHWIAWYSTRYALPFGPYKFFGLPGLIVKVEDETGSYIFEMERNLIARPHYHRTIVHDNIQTLSKAVVIKRYDDARFSMASFTGATLPPGLYQKIEKNLQEDRKKYNNPLELKP